MYSAQYIVEHSSLGRARLHFRTAPLASTSTSRPTTRARAYRKYVLVCVCVCVPGTCTPIFLYSHALYAAPSTSLKLCSRASARVALKTTQNRLRPPRLGPRIGVFCFENCTRWWRSHYFSHSLGIFVLIKSCWGATLRAPGICAGERKAL